MFSTIMKKGHLLVLLVSINSIIIIIKSSYNIKCLLYR